MASNDRKRQEKLARKAAKRRQHAAEVRRATADSAMSLSAKRQMQLATTSPVHECLVPAGLFERGIGSVVVSRRLPGGDIVASVFLLDVYCLGVKNAFFRAASPGEYHSLVSQISARESLQRIEPECVRKLVEGAESYARDLGFSPHPDYFPSAMIFAGIDPAACLTEFAFGKDGKPFYVSGPYDTPARSKRIVDTLARRCGPGNYEVMVMLGDPDDLDLEIGEFSGDEEEWSEDGEEGHQEPHSAPRGWLSRLLPFHGPDRSGDR